MLLIEAMVRVKPDYWKFLGMVADVLLCIFFLFPFDAP